MDKILKDLKPYEVFKYFEQVSQIPRGSGNEKGTSDYLVRFAKEHNLEVIQDKALNIIIKKPGTSGYENAPTVILQGHMDMVCEKNIGTDHDFEKDPIRLVVEKDMIRAEGTTLGGDDGIAIAYCLALLESEEISHPPIEVLITTEEETGMGGAVALDPDSIKGRLLINMDSEEEGKLLVSCSGGVRSKIKLKASWEEPDRSFVSFAIRIRGLKGGHSGMDISKGRGNSNKILGRFLADISEDIHFQINSISGGAKSNAIPREADAVILVKTEDIDLLKEKTEYWNKILKNELKASDHNISISLDTVDITINKVMTEETKLKAVKLLYLIPSGVQTMSMEIKDLVQSSTNLGVVTTMQDEIVFDSAIRSSVRSLKEDIVTQSKIAAETVGAEFTTESDYPEWQYNNDSELRKLFINAYRDLYGKEPEIVAIHAGVECGLFKEKFGEIDMISLGPDMFDVHTPNEHLSISSVARTWEYLQEVLKRMK